MQQDIVEKVKNNPKYKELVAKRTPFIWILSALMLGAYYGFILIIAFAPSVFAQSIGGSVITVGIPAGLGIIIFAFVVTGVYVYRANGEFDRLTKEIKEELK
ncbi:DUF485 domain-containing protein [Thioflexithrix psekupsensis]|uniref:DUF485 domain-containing protein n=1 Tax=Thioflexithrix psekupsensis TaxID=1570016 RepID=A0A251XCX1_9GAMM|nr:DUF485 domain-containing protein [Thioflexithrix psekupsensis]OUD16282.1 hypothetical protein TPSD3_00745 [Thioflexithrix psekupsensis]